MKNVLKIKSIPYVLLVSSICLFATQSVLAEKILIPKCDWNQDLKAGDFLDNQQATVVDSFLTKFEIKPITEAEYDAAKPLPSWFEAVEIQVEANGHIEFPLENGKKLVFRNEESGIDSDSSPYLIGMYPELNAYFFKHSQFEYTDFPLYSKFDGHLLAKFGHVTVKHPTVTRFLLL